MKIRRRLIAVSLAGSLLSILFSPLDCRAGWLCDWLFKRNRRQGVASVAAPVAPAVSGTAVTAGFPPTSTCGAAHCQQTVVRYAPQIAYRTAFQPVPVTTYQTSTSINPANGLPMTCTRPCTSYTYQAQRVPYTAYRPVYTTVPVTLPPGGGMPPGTAPSPSAMPPSSPDYVPGPAPGGPFHTSPGIAPSAQDPAGATPWTPASPNAVGSQPTSDDVPGATPWRPAGAPTSSVPQGTSPADVDPSLRPEIPDTGQRALRPVPRRDWYRQDATDPRRDKRESRRPEIQESRESTDPDLQGPTNQEVETRARGYDSRAVRDLDRERREGTYTVPWSNSKDKTAWRSEPARVPAEPAKLARESREEVTRHTAAPVRWAVDHRSPQHRGRDATSQTWQWQGENESSGEGWFSMR